MHSSVARPEASAFSAERRISRVCSCVVQGGTRARHRADACRSQLLHHSKSTRGARWRSTKLRGGWLAFWRLPCEACDHVRLDALLASDQTPCLSTPPVAPPACGRCGLRSQSQPMGKAYHAHRNHRDSTSCHSGQLPPAAARRSNSCSCSLAAGLRSEVLLNLRSSGSQDHDGV